MLKPYAEISIIENKSIKKFSLLEARLLEGTAVTI